MALRTDCLSGPFLFWCFSPLFSSILPLFQSAARNRASASLCPIKSSSLFSLLFPLSLLPVFFSHLSEGNISFLEDFFLNTCESNGRVQGMRSLYVLMRLSLLLSRERRWDWAVKNLSYIFAGTMVSHGMNEKFFLWAVMSLRVYGANFVSSASEALRWREIRWRSVPKWRESSPIIW